MKRARGFPLKRPVLWLGLSLALEAFFNPLPGASADRGRPNLLLVTVDTLRADRLGAYGNRQVRTPYIDGLAARGVVFNRAFAQASTTLPAHACILLGTSPAYHGVRDNANFIVRGEMLSLAEHLRSAGYATGAFVGGFPLDSRFGLDQGFDVYDDRFEQSGSEPEEGGERRAEAVLAAALPWLNARRGPWFLWVHFWDPHDPYAPPEPFRSQYADRPYDGEVAYVDSVVGRLRKHLADSGQDKTTCFVFTADHGESLGEHGERTHGFLAYNTTIWVPLIISAPGLPPRRVERNVSHLDIFPTVCDLLGLSRPDVLQGSSLSPGMKGGRPAAPEPIYFESLSPFYNMGWAPLQGYVLGEEKFIDSPLPEVFDLGKDFLEKQNVSDSRGLARRRQTLRELIARLSSAGAEGAGQESDRETLERLRSLGYVANLPSAGRRTFGPEDDVKSLLPFHNRAMAGLDLFRAGKPREAQEAIRAVITAKRNISTAYINLAYIYRSQDRLEDSTEVLRAGYEALPENYGLYSQYLTSLYSSGRFEEVLRLFEERRMPQADFDPVIWNYAGLAGMKIGDEAKAREYFERSLSIDRKFAVPLGNLGNLEYFVFKRTRDPAAYKAAVEYYRQALALDPAYGAAHLGLGVVLYLAADSEASIPSLESALKHDPGLHEALYFLGLNYLRKGDRERTCDYFTRYSRTPAFAQLSASERARVAEIVAGCREAP